MNNKINNREEFIEDSIFDDGLEYGFFYSALVVDMCNRKYNDKIIIVDFKKTKLDDSRLWRDFRFGFFKNWIRIFNSLSY